MLTYMWLAKTNFGASHYRLLHKKEAVIMPLALVPAGQKQSIKRVGGREDTRRFLETLGFVVGGDVTVVAKTGGNVIVNVKESRVAISREMAAKIIV